METFKQTEPLMALVQLRIMPQSWEPKIIFSKMKGLKEIPTKQYRADLPAWIFIGGLSSLPWLIVWADAVHGVHLTDLFVAILLSGFSLTWLGFFKITITPTELIYRSLFSGKRTVRHDEIKKVRLEWKVWGARRSPRLVVETARSETDRLDMNAKVFSRGAIEVVLQLGSLAKADDEGLRDGVALK